MRHRKSFNHLSRKAGHRKAMLANMATSLIIHKRIETTTAKAKALRMYVEPLITKSKNDSTHSRRVVFSYLQNKDAVNELFREVSTKIATRPGGYTRILKTGSRPGDNADMCIIELVDYNENLLAVTEESKTKAGTTRRRRRRGGGKGSTSTESAAQKQEKTEEVTEKDTSEDQHAEEAASAVKTDEVISDAEVIEETKEEKDKPEEQASGEEDVKAKSDLEAESTAEEPKKEEDKEEKKDNEEK
jgi:large subunit ribosomal protein L17